MNIQEFTNKEDWIIAALSEIPSDGHIALSGGSTPQPLYEKLPQSAHYYQVDERYISSTDNASNQKMILNAFHPQKFTSINTDLPIEQSIEDYSKKLPSQFDLTILGIGEDGHFASLFPFQKSHGKVAHTQTEQFEIKDRITLTAEPILNSKKILVLLKNKPQVLAELKNPTKTEEEFPAHQLSQHPNLIILSYA